MSNERIEREMSKKWRERDVRRPSEREAGCMPHALPGVPSRARLC